MWLGIFLSISVVTTVWANPTVQLKNTVNYRLPETYFPSTYEVVLMVHETTFQENNDPNINRTFDGEVTINITNKNPNPENELKLHSSHSYIKINKINLNNEDVSVWNVDPVTDILTIPGVSAENVTLKINFTGTHGNDMYGFYLSNYLENGKNKYLVTTQFQATHGRRAFPMFDEPQFKAKFQITIKHPSHLTALSNTNGKSTVDAFNPNITTTTFEQTPIMSSYLIAFVVSEFTCDESTEFITSVPHQICSREQMKSWRGLALEDGPQILNKLNEYTGINYNETFKKMHQVAIPDFSAGAMENWGLVTYRETALLWNVAESSNRYKQRVSTVISHEFAHMWFGNLVTTKWWNTTFLNEGFATLFEMFATNLVHPDWELDKQFVLDDHQVALEADSLLTAKALESEANSPAEVSAKFDTISYSKGGSILRMVQHFLGFENFQKGIQTYLKERSFSTTIPSQLWDALEKNATEDSKLPASLNEVMTNWVTLNGYPLVTVKSTADGVQLTQSRFLFGSGNIGESRKWFVPISYTKSQDANKFVDTLPKVWLTPKDTSVNISLAEGSQWIILNNQESAYYRVNYDDALWANISAALLKDNFDGIHEINRAQIVDDIFALARSGLIHYSKLFQIADFLKNDVSYYPWSSAFNGFNFLIRRIGLSSKLGQSMQNHLIGWMTKLTESVPFNKLDNTNQTYTHNQVLTLTWACRLGLESCKTPALEAFKAYKKSDKRPDPNLRSIIYCNGLRYSDSKDDWNYLWEKYLNTTEATEQVTLISALGCTENQELLLQYLKYSTNSTFIRPQDAASVYSAVYTSGSEIGVNVAFEFLVENHKLIETSYRSMNALGNIVRGIAERFTNQEQIEKLKKLTTILDQDSLFFTAANEAINTATANLDWLTKRSPELEEFFTPEPTTQSTSEATSDATSQSTSEATPETSTKGNSATYVTVSLLFLISLVSFNIFI